VSNKLRDSNEPGEFLSPLKVAVIYAIAGSLWILFSDTLLHTIVDNPEVAAKIQTIKGWLFILVTAALVYFLTRKLVSSIRHMAYQNRRLFEESPIGLILTRLDGSPVYGNPAVLAIVDRTQEEIETLGYWELTPKKWRDKELEQNAELRKKGWYGPYEKEVIHRDGHLVPVRLRGRILNRHGEQFIWSSIEDISKQKKIEVELEHHRNHLQKLVDESTAELQLAII